MNSREPAESAARYPSPSLIRLPQLLLLLTLAMMLAARILGPSALYRFDQPKTATYTADIVVHGRWLLPRDILGNPSTKPPLVNWLAAPIVKAGFWTEWALKLPMLAGSLATLGLCIWMARRIAGRLPEADADPHFGAHLPAIAGIAWLTNPANLTALYHCRPDPLLLGFLTLGWVLGTRIVDPAQRLHRGEVLVFWLAVGLAALTKGPPAILPVLYLPLAARLLHGGWASLARTGWWWGLPLAGVLFGAWLVPMALQNPEHFRDVLVGKEILAPALGMGAKFNNLNINESGPLHILTGCWQNPVWFCERFAPWSVLAIAAACWIGPRQWFRHPLGPAILWILLVGGFFSLIAHKTADYLLPAYPAAAILAAWFGVSVLRRWRVQAAHVALAGFALGLALSIDWVWFSSPAKERIGENVRQFAAEARLLIGEDSVLCLETGYNTAQFFLHEHQVEPPTPEQVAAAQWVVMPACPGVTPALLSGRIASGSAKASRRPGLALYRIEDVRELLPGMLRKAGR